MTQRFRTILIDPPWDNADSLTPKDPFHTYEGGWPYPTMRLVDIANLPIPDLIDPAGCHLWLWAMNSFMPHAYWLLTHWGFKYHITHTWVKPSGVGHWFVDRTQHLLFGYTGRLQMRTKMLPNVFGAPAVEHSRKPDISYEFIEQVSFDAKVELFARRPRPGWDVWGNEVESTVQMR